MMKIKYKVKENSCLTLCYEMTKGNRKIYIGSGFCRACTKLLNIDHNNKIVYCNR